MKKVLKITSTLLFFFIASVCFADVMDSNPSWTIDADLGLTNYRHMYLHDGNSALARLSIEKTLMSEQSLRLGLAIGIQNGGTMRLDIPKETLDVLGGEPLSISIKPTLDMLGTLSIMPFDDGGIYFYLKGGVAYRALQVDRNEANDLTTFTPEIIAGIGDQLNDNLAIQLSAQYLFGSNPNFTLNQDLRGGTINHVPAQKSLFIGFKILI